MRRSLLAQNRLLERTLNILGSNRSEFLFENISTSSAFFDIGDNDDQGEEQFEFPWRNSSATTPLSNTREFSTMVSPASYNVNPVRQAGLLLETQQLLSSLTSSSGKANARKYIKVVPGVHRLADISYGESDLQSLDVYLPEEHLLQEQNGATPRRRRPVYIHIHGGGWSRGRKDSPIYGGPATCQNMAANGCIAVAPGYRLGKYPDFMHDTAAAIRWVIDHLDELGGDPSNIFLSGHSAGGHIASLLVLRHSCFLAPLDIPQDFFRGLVLFSGVYDLFRPLRKAMTIDAKNKLFVWAYAIPAFGKDEQLRREASPLLLLDPKKCTTRPWVGRGVESLLNQVNINNGNSSGGGGDDDDPNHANTCLGLPQDPYENFEINTSSIPNTLILNAVMDMGLRENGELMAKALSKYTNVEYHVSALDHASICWCPKTGSKVVDFVKAQCL